MRITNRQTSLGILPWANLFAITTAPVGTTALVSDLNYAEMVWTGTRWRPPCGSVTLGVSGTPVTLTGTTSPTTLASVAVPGGLMGPSGKLRVRHGYTITNSANTKTISLLLNATNITLLNYVTVGIADFTCEVNNRGSASSQVTSISSNRVTDLVVALPGSTRTTSAVNTDANFTVNFNATLGLSSESVILDAYSVEALIP